MAAGFFASSLEATRSSLPYHASSVKSQRKGLPMTSPCHKRRRGHTKPLYGGFLRRNKRKKRQRKSVNEEFFFSKGGEKGLEVSVENSKAANK